MSTVALGLAGCGAMPEGLRSDKRPQDDSQATTAAGLQNAANVQEPILAPETTAPPPPPAARTVEALDTTTPAQRAAASAPAPEGARILGTTVASLGSPSEPGLWIKTPLVKTEMQGRVTNPSNGKSSTVTLIPIDGPVTAGSRMSLAALRLIGASLTDLTTVEVSTVG